MKFSPFFSWSPQGHPPTAALKHQLRRRLHEEVLGALPTSWRLRPNQLLVGTPEAALQRVLGRINDVRSGEPIEVDTTEAANVVYYLVDGKWICVYLQPVNLGVQPWIELAPDEPGSAARIQAGLRVTEG